MNDSTRQRAPWVAGVFLAALGVAAAGRLWLGGGDHQAPVHELVTSEVVAEALSSRPPEPRSLTDEIRHFEARLASRGEERFSRVRLVSGHLLRFRAYGAEDDLRAAERHLEAAMEGAPNSPSLLSTRSAVHLLRHEFPRALTTARRANRSFGDFDSGLRLRLFDALWAGGAYEEATGLLELDHDRGSFDYLVRRARVLDRAGRTEAARDRLRAALKQARAYAQPAPVEAWALVELGHFEHHSGRPDLAVSRYLEALHVLPGSPHAVEGLGWIAYGVDRNLTAAEELFRRAFELGGHLDLLPTIADVAEERGRKGEATRIRDRFVKEATADPRRERAHWRPLSLLLAERPGHRHEAIRYAVMELENRPDPGSWDALAWTLHKAGATPAACRAMERATERGLPEPAVLYHAGVIARGCEGEHWSERSEELLGAALEGQSELGPATIRHIRKLLDVENSSRTDPR